MMTEQLLRLDSNASTLLIEVNAEAPVIRYWGARLNADPAPGLWGPALPQAGQDEVRPLSIASTLADGTFLEPALRAHFQGAGWAPQWRVQNVRQNSNQIGFDLLSSDQRYRLRWQVTLDTSTDVLAFDVTIENQSDRHLALEQWLTTLPLPRSFGEMLGFTGRWVQEFQPNRQALPIGSLEFTNLKGRTSHDHFPGVLVGETGFGAQRGEVFAFHLGWSGNHRLRLERSQSGLTQFQAGAHLLPGEIDLEPGEDFTAPTLFATRSASGFNTIGHNFQRFVRQQLLRWPEQKPRPVHINTWEAIYFDHTQKALDDLASAATEVGAERYVLDDGWFQGRRNDRAGLGDWTVDTQVYPEKLHPLAATLNQQGLEFGLWVEPEMVNPDSNLYRAHPEWALAIEGQHQPLARQQRVLDLTRPEVEAWLFEHLDALLKEYPITYLKWDMNRDLVQAANQTGRAATHKQTLALYRLLTRIRNAHPGVEIESCASGGARMDYGILKHTHRFWLSDCNDAHERQQMQQWASLFFPAEVLGSHIGPLSSHTTGRMHSLATRAGTALFGHMGIEWDVRQLTANERKELRHFIQLHKEWRDLIHSGVRSQLNADDPNQIAFQILPESDSDEDRHLVSVFQRQAPQLALPGVLKLTGLEATKLYRLVRLIEPDKTGHLMKAKPAWINNDTAYSGDSLMKVGLPLPVMDPDTLLVFSLVPDKE